MELLVKLRAFSVVALAGVLLLPAAVDFATAGVEPEPFRNQLGAAENMLSSAGDRIVKSIEHPPDPCCPSPNLNGALGRLGAIDNQLMLVNEMVVSVMEEVLGVDPEPFQPAELLPALYGVKSAADEIVEVLGVDPTPFAPEFADALLVVQGTAMAISTNVQGYIDEISGTVACHEITEPVACALAGCVWSPDAMQCAASGGLP